MLDFIFYKNINEAAQFSNPKTVGVRKGKHFEWDWEIETLRVASLAGLENCIRLAKETDFIWFYGCD